MNILTKDCQLTSDLLDENEAAKLLSLAAGTLSVWRSTGRYGVPFVKVGRLVRYKRTDLEAWISSRTHASSTAA